MKQILSILLLSFTLLAADKPIELLNSIKQHSIDIGRGKTNEVYVFVDPMCPYSRKFIKKISENKMLQLINSYHVFLYKLPKYDSTKLSNYIYKSSDSHKALLDVMVNEKDIDLDNFKLDKEKIKNLQKIAMVGKKLKIVKRPYMILFEADSGYCRVSEGEASCMEEFDFD